MYGISRRSPLGLALAAGGGTIALLGATRKNGAQQTCAETTLLINTSPQDAFRFWRDFENLPRFMNRLENVTVLDDGRSRWTVLGPMGRRISWESEITGEREGEYIAWRSLPNSDIQVDGRVEFREAAAGRGTLISARLEFRAVPGGNTALAKLLTKGESFAMRQEMRRLEALLETGEIPTTEGQPHGPRDFITAVARAADPTRPIGPANVRDIFAAKRGIA